MKLLIVPLLALSTTTAQARRTSSHRTLQATNNEADTTTVITGTGVQEAEITPEATSTYTSTQCLQWLQGAFDADGDSSHGLSRAEFHDFLLTIEEPPYVREYFAQHEDYQSMPWEFKVLHHFLACRCKDLGMGDGCCTGPNAEVPIAVMEKTSSQQYEYQADFCYMVAFSIESFIEEPNPTASPVESLVVVTTAATTTTVAATTTKEPVVIVPAPTEPIVPGKGIVMDVVGSVLDYSAFDYSGIFVGDEEGIPDFFHAADIMGNTDENNVLGQVIEAFNVLAFVLKYVALPDITEESKRRGLRSNKQREGGARKLAGIGTLLPVKVKVTDISCPSGLTYAPNGAYCLNFKFIIENNIATDLTPLGEMLEDVINDEGGLYDVVKANNPDSALTGMGSPGRGIVYQPAC